MAIDPSILVDYALPSPDWQPSWVFKPADAERLALIAEVERMFPPQPLGEGLTWLQAEMRDNHEPQEIILAGRAIDLFDRWTDVPDGLLAKYPAAAGFLDDAGQRFYLPAGMRFELRYRSAYGPVIDALFPNPFVAPRHPCALIRDMPAIQSEIYERFYRWQMRPY